MDTERDCGQLTFADSEHQAKRRADTPEPFTQIHRCVRGLLSPVLSKAKQMASERTVRGLSHLTVNPLALAVLRKKRLTREDESYLQARQRRKRSQAARQSSHVCCASNDLPLLLPQCHAEGRGYKRRVPSFIPDCATLQVRTGFSDAYGVPGRSNRSGCVRVQLRLFSVTPFSPSWSQDDFLR